MKIHHRPSHWVAVALVLAALMLALNEAHGQGGGAGAAAVFEGRPAMAGAQAGLGAQAGPPQGGVGVQGSEAAQRNLHVRRPGAPGQLPRVPGKADDEVLAARAEARAPAERTDVVPSADRNAEETSTTK